MQDDTVITLPNGTEISVEAALGDVWRAAEFLSGLQDDDYAMGLGSDLTHVAELIKVLGKTP